MRAERGKRPQRTHRQAALITHCALLPCARSLPPCSTGLATLRPSPSATPSTRRGLERRVSWTSTVRSEQENATQPASQPATRRHGSANANAPPLPTHVGMQDIMVPMGGDAFAGFVPVMDNMRNWTQRNSCSGPPVQTFNNSEGFSNMVGGDLGQPLAPYGASGHAARRAIQCRCGKIAALMGTARSSL